VCSVVAAFSTGQVDSRSSGEATKGLYIFVAVSRPFIIHIRVGLMTQLGIQGLVVRLIALLIFLTQLLAWECFAGRPDVCNIKDGLSRGWLQGAKCFSHTFNTNPHIVTVLQSFGDPGDQLVFLKLE
jgi:hypothetical protein